MLRRDLQRKATEKKLQDDVEAFVATFKRESAPEDWAALSTAQLEFLGHVGRASVSLNFQRPELLLVDWPLSDEPALQIVVCVYFFYSRDSFKDLTGFGRKDCFTLEPEAKAPKYEEVEKWVQGVRERLMSKGNGPTSVANS